MLDLKLPGIDRITVLKAIKSIPDRSSIPVVVLTASASDVDVNRTMARGIDEYIVKPMDLQFFVKQMRQIAARFTKH